MDHRRTCIKPQLFAVLLSIVWCGLALGIPVNVEVPVDASRLVKNIAENFPSGGRPQCQGTTVPGGVNCTIGAIDLVFVIDESGSIGGQNFNQALNFLAQLTSSLNIGPSNSQSHVGMVEFDTNGHVLFYLNHYLSNNGVRNAILGAPYSGGGTNIAAGMNTAINQVFTSSSGDRPGVKNIMIVMADGQDTSNVRAAQQAAQHKGITIYAIGVGPDVDMQELILVTGSASRVFTINDFGGLGCLLPQICQQLTTTNQMTTATAQPTPANHVRQCACTPSKTWLDIVVVLDNSAAMVEQDFNEVKSVLYSYVRSLNVSQLNGNAGSRIGIISYANTANTIATLSTYTSSAQAALAILTVQYMRQQTHANLVQALVTAEGAINDPGNRQNVPDLLILVSSEQRVRCAQFRAPADPSGPSIKDGNDPCAIADSLKQRGITILAIATIFRPGDPNPLISVASPCFALKNDRNLDPMLAPTICKANCFCSDPNFVQFKYNCSFFAECVALTTTPVTWIQAQATCTQTNAAYIADVFSAQKEIFMTNQVLDPQNGVPPGVSTNYWIGLNDYGHPGRYIWDRNLFNPTGVPVSPLDYSNYGAGQPNDGIGNCISSNRSPAGWYSNDCMRVTTNLPFFCQTNACDTDNVCG